MVTPQPDAGPPVVPRLIEELDAHPEAREPLLRALLTDEFLHMPARLARIEGIVESSQGDMKVVQGDMKVVQGDMKVVQGDMKVVQGDMKVVQGDMKVVQGDVKNLQVDVGWLKGKALETDFGHRATSIMNLRFGLRRCRVVLGKTGAMAHHAESFAEQVEDAHENGRITTAQLARIFNTDVIVRCRRPSDSRTVWVAAEVAGRLDYNDIDRAVRSADALRLAFGDDVLPLVAGERIDPPDLARAQQAGVAFVNMVDYISQQI